MPTSSNVEAPQTELSHDTIEALKQLISKLKNPKSKAFPFPMILGLMANNKKQELQLVLKNSDPRKSLKSLETLSLFLELRRLTMAIIVEHAARVQKLASYNILHTSLDALAEILNTKDWDWNSFCEKEYDFFISLAKVSNNSSFEMVLKQFRDPFLNESYNLTKEFWDMDSMLPFYEKLVKTIEAHQAVQAKAAFLEFFEKNDGRVIFYFQKLLKQNL